MQITVKRNNYCLVHGGGQKASTKQLQSPLANSEMLTQTAIKLPPDLGVCQTVIQSEFLRRWEEKNTDILDSEGNKIPNWPL